MNKKVCFHCGSNIQINDCSIIINGVTYYMCCFGCLAVTKFIINNGFEDYYKNRSSYGYKIEDNFFNNNLTIDTHTSYRFISKKKADLSSVSLFIDGITCAACTWLIERYISKINGVHSISVNLLTSKAKILWNDKIINLEFLFESFTKIGYKAHLYDFKKQEKRNQDEFKRELKKVIVSGLGMMQIMMLSASLYVGEFKDMNYLYWIFIRWSCFIIAFPVTIYSARSLFLNFYKNIKNGFLGMDFNVSLSLIIAFIASMNNLIKNNGEIYFDSITMFVFFILLGKFLEMRVRHHASDIIYSLQKIENNITIKIDSNNIYREILVENVQVNDLLLIKPGCLIPVDGQIVDGESSINESMLTGESEPILKNLSEAVFGGTINIDNTLIIKATHTYSHSTISLIIQTLEKINLTRPKINILIDKIADYFVLFVILLTIITSIIWLFLDKKDIINIIISMLVIACPCALSLAVPAAITSTTNSLIKIGFLITKEHTINTLEKVTDIIFDKTGTLTNSNFTLSKIKLKRNISIKKVISIVCALEYLSNHPIAKAFIKFNKIFKNEFNSKLDVKTYSGLGVEGKIDNKFYRFGKYDFIKNWVKKDLNKEIKYNLLLADKNGIIAYFKLVNPLRKNTKLVINALKKKKYIIHILSGDSSNEVDLIAHKLRIDKKKKNITVKGKVEYIKGLTNSNKIVLMIGDGINDSPALNAAHASIAMGSGADLTKINSDAILLNDNLLNILKAMAQSKKTKFIIKQNIVWAILYNFIGLLFASFNFITPYYAALGMSTSSLIVIFNSLRLNKIK